jgi:hypothetical protein
MPEYQDFNPAQLGHIQGKMQRRAAVSISNHAKQLSFHSRALGGELHHDSSSLADHRRPFIECGHSHRGGCVADKLMMILRFRFILKLWLVFGCDVLIGFTGPYGSRIRMIAMLNSLMLFVFVMVSVFQSIFLKQKNISSLRPIKIMSMRNSIMPFVFTMVEVFHLIWLGERNISNSRQINIIPTCN